MHLATLKSATALAVVSAAFLLASTDPGGRLGRQDQDEKPASRPGKPGSEPPPPPAAIPVYDGPLIALTGNERGFIRPCGCSKPKLGGVDRRAFALAKLREKNPQLVAVSTGGLLNGGGRQAELKIDAFIMSMSVMNYAAFVPGPDDFRIGAKALAERKGMAPFPFVLANAKVGDVAFEPQVKLGDSGGVLIGLIEPQKPETGVTTTGAAEALARELASCGDAAFILVIYNGEEDGLDALGKVVPEALRAKTIFSVPGHADAPIETAKPVLGMPVVVPGGKGRAIGLIRPGKKPLLDAYVLVETLPVDPTCSEILQGYKKSIREENLVTQINRTSPPSRYAGDERCKECHTQAGDDLADTMHQHAFATLEKTGDERDPECVKCHVTGYGFTGGYVDVDATPDRKDVDCEACHGPGLDHLERNVKTPGGKIGRDQCMTCHDADNAPGFNFETYWPKIIHR